jgi:hypothetical protein
VESSARVVVLATGTDVEGARLLARLLADRASVSLAPTAARDVASSDVVPVASPEEALGGSEPAAIVVTSACCWSGYSRVAGGDTPTRIGAARTVDLAPLLAAVPERSGAVGTSELDELREAAEHWQRVAADRAAAIEALHELNYWHTAAVETRDVVDGLSRSEAAWRARAETAERELDAHQQRLAALRSRPLRTLAATIANRARARVRRRR